MEFEEKIENYKIKIPQKKSKNVENPPKEINEEEEIRDPKEICLTINEIIAIINEVINRSNKKSNEKECNFYLNDTQILSLLILFLKKKTKVEFPK